MYRGCTGTFKNQKKKFSDIIFNEVVSINFIVTYNKLSTFSGH